MPPTRSPDAPGVRPSATAETAAYTLPLAAVPLAVEQTSLANRNNAPDEVTVRFHKWHAEGSTAYQRGQYAGFKRAIAQRLIANGHATLVADHSSFVTK